MEPDLTERIKTLAAEKGLSSTAFADAVEVPRPVMSHIFSGRNRPSLEVVQKIGVAFPELDLAWLLYGQGEMLKIIAPLESYKQEPVLESVPSRKPMISEPQEKINEEQGNITSTNPPIKPKVPTARQVIKIVYFYDDHTFEEFRSLRNQL